MKTIDQIKDDIINELSIEHNDNYASWDNLLEWVDKDLPWEMVAERYARQACEDLRERIAEQAKVKTVATLLGDYHEVNKETILNTEIILP